MYGCAMWSCRISTTRRRDMEALNVFMKKIRFVDKGRGAPVTTQWPSKNTASSALPTGSGACRRWTTPDSWSCKADTQTGRSSNPREPVKRRREKMEGNIDLIYARPINTRNILTFTFPTMVRMLFVSMYTIVDGIVVSTMWAVWVCRR